MWQLDYRKYDIVHFIDSKIQPWIVNPHSMKDLGALADFMIEVRKVLSESYLNNTYDALQSIYFKERNQASYGPDKILEALGIVNYSLPSKPFLDHVEFNNFKSQTGCILFSEKNLIPQHPGRGSSRHAQGCNFQFKGVGRNSMAHNEDYYHSWGGFVSRDALRSVLADRFITERTKLGCLRTMGVFKYVDEFLGKTPLVMALRENNGFRLSQISPTFLTPGEKKYLTDHLYEKFQSSNLKDIFAHIVDHYVHAFSVGVIHRSVSQENLTLDGRFLDTESIEYSLEFTPCPFYIKLGSVTNDRNVLDENSKIQIHPNSKPPFFGSWLHDLMLMSELTANAFEAISGESFDWYKQCLSACDQYLEKDYRDWIPLLKVESFGRKYMLSNNLPIAEVSWTKELQGLTQQYVCTASFYDLTTKLLMNTFSARPDETRKKNINSLIKYDLALWGKPCNWENAFENWNIINP